MNTTRMSTRTLGACLLLGCALLACASQSEADAALTGALGGEGGGLGSQPTGGGSGMAGGDNRASAGGNSSAGRGPEGGSAGSGDALSLACVACLQTHCPDLASVGTCTCQAEGDCSGVCPCVSPPPDKGENTGSSGTSGSSDMPAPAAGGSKDAPRFELDCTNGEDDDADSQVDCDDSECAIGCGALCGAPTRLVHDVSREGHWKGHSADHLPDCASTNAVGPTIAYRYEATATGWLTLSAASQGNVILEAYPGECGSTSGYNYCRNTLGPGGEEQLTVKVEAGQVWTVILTNAKKQTSESFKLSAKLIVPECGNGKVEPGEQCDDSNTMGGDGCSATCTIDACNNATALSDVAPGAVSASVEGKVEGQTSKLHGSCAAPSAATGSAVYSVRAVSSGLLEVNLTPQGDPGSDLVLSVWNSCVSGAELACADRGEAGVAERVSVPAEAGQWFYLVVEGRGATDVGAYTLQAQTFPVSCGDGIVAPSAEQCDPADSICAKTCTRLEPASPEVGVGEVLLAEGAVGAIFPSGDVDEYKLTVVKPTVVTVQEATSDGDCAKLHLDSQLEVLTPDQTIVGFNDDAPSDSGLGYCSQVKLSQPGTYVLRVRASVRSAPTQVFSYRIVATPAS